MKPLRISHTDGAVRRESFRVFDDWPKGPAVRRHGRALKQGGTDYWRVNMGKLPDPAASAAAGPRDVSDATWRGKRDLYMEVTARNKHPRARIAYRAAGYAFVGLGTAGVFLPLMPTTCFMIAALACFTRGSPSVAAKLLSHPRYGPALVAWQQRPAISARAKCLAVASMATAFVVAAAISSTWLMPTVTGCVLAIVALYVVTRPIPTR